MTNDWSDVKFLYFTRMYVNTCTWCTLCNLLTARVLSDRANEGRERDPKYIERAGVWWAMHGYRLSLSWLSIPVTSTGSRNHVKSCISLMSLWPNRKPVCWNSMFGQDDVIDIRNLARSGYWCRFTGMNNQIKKVCRCGNDVGLAQLLLCGLISCQTYWIWSCPYISRLYIHKLKMMNTHDDMH